MTDDTTPEGPRPPETPPAPLPVPEKIGRDHLDPDLPDPRDPLLVPFSKFDDRDRGLSVVDAMRWRPGKSIPRQWVNSREERQLEYSIAGHKVLLCPGAAVGLDEDGRCRHIRPYHRLQGFIGFVLDHIDGNGTVRAVVKAAGIAALRVEGLQPGDEGKSVYVSDVNSFSLAAAGGYLLGRILHIQPDWPGEAQVIFRAFDLEASKQEALDVSQRRR